MEISDINTPAENCGLWGGGALDKAPPLHTKKINIIFTLLSTEYLDMISI